MQAQTDSLPSQNRHEDWSGQGELNPRLITRPSVNRSALFICYNALKGLNVTDAGRANRGLGLAQRRNPETKYVTTTTSCTCPDFSGIAPNGRRFRMQSLRPCKHIVAETLRFVASEVA